MLKNKLPYILSVNEKGNLVNSNICIHKKCKPAPRVSTKDKKISLNLLLTCKASSNQTKEQLDVNKTKVLYKGKAKGFGACIPTGGQIPPIHIEGLIDE